ncbi:Pkinase-domain-containing protein [Basidiobolus meristosporus CBS 931.73]|uniref:Pkinase-domain-containing protein n=1 Tax=Basidiobolus meristosporus CBS 931.73 TaxID=1314790 RepID=A0A1Y1YD12_9FUNG|nr:Pkinase-domain-containing protein [Basidiobolus meristosporus CBS 931.73]|eukprot:ORX95910.1 Pkinase-domain-containing protein [Basidiobolus meristosporus CBS 931.73]
MIKQIKNFLKTATSVPSAESAQKSAIGSEKNAFTAPSVSPQSAPDLDTKPLPPPKPELSEDLNSIFMNPKYANDPNLPVYPNLDRYQLLTKLGDGAFSNVYKAYDQYREKLVAIKVVRKFELNSLQRGNILKEVTIMRTLNHPNIAKLLDFKESKDFYYLVLELVTGGELFHRIVKLTYFSEDLARHVITQVAKGIRYLHEEKGVVHRDIKPENLLFEPIPIRHNPNRSADRSEEHKVDEGEFIDGVGGGGIGVVKIADFGLSKVIWNKDTMTPCGTVGYTAPEIVKDEGYSKAVDMWALGCVLYTMLCGFPPFYDDDIKSLTAKVARGYYSFLSPWWDDISDSSKDLISHLLTVNPQRRYTINQFLAHPWITAKKTVQFEVPAEDAAPRTAVEHVKTPYHEVPKAYVRKERHPIPVTPNVSIKEAFDVSYAMHRMEDEEAGKRRMRAMQEQFEKAQGMGTYQPYYQQRMFMDAVDNDNYEEDIGIINTALTTQMRDPCQPRTRHIAKPNKTPVMVTGRQVNHRRAGFELNMNNATLLSRRKQKQEVH